MILWLTLLLMGVMSASAQQLTLKGKVLDNRGEPLIGVSVVEKGSTNGCITDFDGNFSLQTTKGKTIVFSYIGYDSQELKVANQKNVTITLKEDAAALEEVVVIGYGSMRKKDLTGSVVQINRSAARYSWSADWL